MSSFSHDQKVALLVVPMLLFGILGVSPLGTAPLFSNEGEATLRRGQGSIVRHEAPKAVSSALRIAIREKDYTGFVEALQDTPYGAYTGREVFDALVHSYELHLQGNGSDAEEQFVRMLYG